MVNGLPLSHLLHPGDQLPAQQRLLVLLVLSLTGAAAQRRDGEGAPAGRGHPAAAQESAEEGRGGAAVHGRG